MTDETQQWAAHAYQAANALAAVDLVVLAALYLAIYLQRRGRDPVASAAPWVSLSFLTLAASRTANVVQSTLTTAHLWLHAATAACLTITVVMIPRAIVGYRRGLTAMEAERQARSLQARLRAAEAAQAELGRHNAILAVRLANLEALLETEGWTASKARALAEMRGAIAAMKEVPDGP